MTPRSGLRLLSAVLLGVLLAAPTQMSAQTTFLGIGPVFSMPQDTFAATNGNAIGGVLTYESRKYCQLWFGVRLHYTRNVAADTLTEGAPFYTDAVSLAPTARFFFTQPLDFPFYVQGMVHYSSISTSDTNSGASPSGLGAGIGVGYLLFYDSNCCNWFLDLYAHYQAPNLILRSDERPALNSIVVGLNFNYSL